MDVLIDKQESHFAIQQPIALHDPSFKDLLLGIGETYSIEEVALLFAAQLLKDARISETERISDCVLYAPNVNRSSQIARLIAKLIFPVPADTPDEQQVIKRKHAYIQYSQLKRTLKNRYLTENPIPKKTPWKLKGKMCTIPHYHPVEEPKAMDVLVAEAEKLQPFFDILKENIPPGDGLTTNHGVLHSDGRMDLCKQVVGPTHIDQLIQSIQNNEHVKHFLIGNNIIGQHGCKSIQQFLANNPVPKIKTWYLAGNDVDEMGAYYLNEALKDNEHIEALWLKRNPIKEGAKYIAALIAENKHLEILDLSNTGLKDEGIKHIFEALKHNTSLRFLYLGANAITEEGAKCIADYFVYKAEKKELGLTHIWIDMNRIGDKGALYIAKALEQYRELKNISVSSNRIGSEGAIALCKSLEGTGIQLFDIGLYKATGDMKEMPNRIGVEGAKAVASLIRNSQIKLVDILLSGIDNEGFQYIYDAALESDTICFIVKSRFEITKKHEFNQLLKPKYAQNIERIYNMSREVFMKKPYLLLRGNYKLRNIDSVYRNNSK